MRILSDLDERNSKLFSIIELLRELDDCFCHILFILWTAICHHEHHGSIRLCGSGLFLLEILAEYELHGWRQDCPAHGRTFSKYILNGAWGRVLERFESGCKWNHCDPIWVVLVD